MYIEMMCGGMMQRKFIEHINTSTGRKARKTIFDLLRREYSTTQFGITY